MKIYKPLNNLFIYYLKKKKKLLLVSYALSLSPIAYLNQHETRWY
jgi:hypothetical protein